MKQLAICAILAALALAGCSSGEAPPASTETPAAQAEPEMLPEAQEPAAQAETDEETQPEFVEESASDEDAAEEEDQPIVLAQAEAGAEQRDWQFEEGTHFTRMVPTQPTVGGPDKIEVAEFFWYGCNHCFDFEPYINQWAENVPANARFVRVPALWNPLVRMHGRLYYTEEVLAKNGKLADPDGFHSAVFMEIQRRGNRLASEGAIQVLFERFGVSAEDFKSTWDSFEVAQKLRVADDLARRYGIASVPQVVVNGKYKTSAGDAGSYPRLLEVIDELIERESVR